MLTRVLGIDIQAIYMTMLGLVGLYLILTHATELNRIIVTSARTGLGGLVILQGRSLKTAGVTSV